MKWTEYNGIFRINLYNLNRVTRNNYYVVSQNSENWTYDEETKKVIPTRER
jgi:hypothetical protein